MCKRWLRLASQRALIGVGLLCLSLPSSASQLSFTLGELLGESSDAPGGNLLLKTVRESLDNASIDRTSGDLLYTLQSGTDVLRGGCNATEVEHSTLTVRVNRDSRLGLGVQSLFHAIDTRFDLNLQFDLRARIRQDVGIRLGGCVKVGQESFDALANGTVTLRANAQLNPGIEEFQPGQFRLNPQVSVVGQAEQLNYSVDVDGSLLEPVLEEFLKREVEDAFSAQKVNEQLLDLQSELQSQVNEAIGEEALSFELPLLRADRQARFQHWLSERSGFPLTQGYIDSQRPAIVRSLVQGDSKALQDLLETVTACDAAQVLLAPTRAEAVYESVNGQCQIAAQPLGDGRYYNSDCSQSFEFQTSSYQALCQQAFGTDHFGDASDLIGQTARWTQSPGSRIDIGAELLGDTPQAYMLRQHYRTVDGGRGQCHLEMRVYKADPTRRDDKTLIAFHGGAWRFRGTGVIGLESSINHFTQAGYTVFMPFYRLSGEKDAPEACRGVAMDAIIDDTEAALAWVEANADRYLSNGQKPALMGQSAGGTLVGWLATQHTERVGKSLVFYAPLDFASAFDDWASGRYTNRDGIRTLSEVLQRDPAQIQATDADVQRISFNQHIAKRDVNPPMWLFYGGADELVPSSQAIGFCAASLGSTPTPNGQSTHPELLTHYSCNSVHASVFKEGDHALDYCYGSLKCPSGSLDSVQLVDQTLKQARAWLSDPEPLNFVTRSAQGARLTADASGGGSAGGAVGWLAGLGVLLLAGFRLRR